MPPHWTHLIIQSYTNCMCKDAWPNTFIPYIHCFYDCIFMYSTHIVPVHTNRKSNSAMHFVLTFFFRISFWHWKEGISIGGIEQNIWRLYLHTTHRLGLTCILYCTCQYTSHSAHTHRHGADYNLSIFKTIYNA